MSLVAIANGILQAIYWSHDKYTMIDGSQNIIILFADQNGICKDETKT